MKIQKQSHTLKCCVSNSLVEEHLWFGVWFDGIQVFEIQVLQTFFTLCMLNFFNGLFLL